MAELNTIARPYAKAAFAIARDEDRLAEWSGMLAAAAAAMAAPDFRALLGNPGVAVETVAGLLHEFAGGNATESGRRFLALLAERRRVHALPAIRALFEALRAEAEDRIDVEVVSAVELDDAQRKRYAEALKKRLGREVVVNAVTDASILGGAIIRAGDLVIDGSVRGRLDKLAAALSH